MDILQRQTISHPFVIGISGVSSSGKTTLSRTLAKIFPHSILLHQDDFFHPASLVPFHSSGEHDWDCVDAIDWDQMRIVLSSIRETGKLPDGFSSITGASPVDSKEKVHDSEELIERMWSKLEVAGMVVLGRKIVIVDGFLMFFDGSPIETMMDAKFLLRISKDVAKSRREARTGYYTIEGFMTDPPGYFDNLVWPSYVNNHTYLFLDGDIHGKLTLEAVQKRRINTPEKFNLSSEEILDWVVDILIREFRKEPIE